MWYVVLKIKKFVNLYFLFLFTSKAIYCLFPLQLSILSFVFPTE